MAFKHVKYGLICSVVLVVTASFAWIKIGLSQPINIEGEREFVVAPGTSANQVVKQLHREQVIQHSQSIRLLFKIDEQFSQIKSGTYLLSPSLSFVEFWQQLMEGKEVNYQITLVEGLTWRDWLSSITSHPKLIQDLNEAQLKTAFDVSSMEGILLPETYIFRANMKASDLIRKAYGDMQDFLQAQWANRAHDLVLNTPYEALIMASIIEKETALNREMPLISGVFNNRLKEKMRLQTDPTVIYGLGEDFNGNITRKHLKDYTPYNTYRIAGLPPTPIAMPSKRAIIAALNPEPTSALFFVAKGDGSHYFSDTLNEHNAAVRKYQLGQE